MRTPAKTRRISWHARSLESSKETLFGVLKIRIIKTDTSRRHICCGRLRPSFLFVCAFFGAWWAPEFLKPGLLEVFTPSCASFVFDDAGVLFR